jgi:uncharacterized membrane protein HdeD (DUF308 family)
MTNTETDQGPTLATAIAAIRSKWKWVLVLGIVYTFAGFVALGSVVAATVASVYVVGAMMILAGIVERDAEDREDRLSDTPTDTDA